MLKTTILAITFLGATTAVGYADQLDNPLFSQWPSKVDATVRFDRTVCISGGIPGAADETVKSELTYKLSKVTPVELTIQTEKESFAVPAKIDSNAPNFPKYIKTEEVEVGGKTCSCAVYHYLTTSAAEVGFNTQGIPAEVTVWVEPRATGGIVCREISLTIKASYNIKDTLMPPTSVTANDRP